MKVSPATEGPGVGAEDVLPSAVTCSDGAVGGGDAAARPPGLSASVPGSSAGVLEGKPTAKGSDSGDGMDDRGEVKDGGMDHGDGRVVPMDRKDGSGEDGRRDGDRVFDELKGFSAGVDTGDEKCDRVATVLRMLYLSDLRSLQDEVNGILAMAQTGRP